LGAWKLKKGIRVGEPRSEKRREKRIEGGRFFDIGKDRGKGRKNPAKGRRDANTAKSFKWSVPVMSLKMEQGYEEEKRSNAAWLILRVPHTHVEGK